jgi:hypothetical protein
MEVPSVPLVPAGAAPRSAGAACSGASSSETRPTSGHCLARPSPYGGCSLARTTRTRRGRSTPRSPRSSPSSGPPGIRRTSSRPGSAGGRAEHDAGTGRVAATTRPTHVRCGSAGCQEASSRLPCGPYPLARTRRSTSMGKMNNHTAPDLRLLQPTTRFRFRAWRIFERVLDPLGGPRRLPLFRRRSGWGAR